MHHGQRRLQAITQAEAWTDDLVVPCRVPTHQTWLTATSTCHPGSAQSVIEEVPVGLQLWYCERSSWCIRTWRGVVETYGPDDKVSS